MWEEPDGIPPFSIIQAPDTDERVSHWQHYREIGAFGLPDRLNRGPVKPPQVRD